MDLRTSFARLTIFVLLSSLFACGSVPQGRDDSSSFQLGGGPPFAQPTPTPVLLAPDRPLAGVVSIALRLRHSLALRDDGTVWSWGASHAGEQRP